MCLLATFPHQKNVTGIRAHTYCKITVKWALTRISFCLRQEVHFFLTRKSASNCFHDLSRTAITKFWKFRGKDHTLRKIETTMTQSPEWLNCLHRWIPKMQHVLPYTAKLIKGKVLVKITQNLKHGKYSFFSKFLLCNPWTNNFTKTNSSIVL